MGRPGRPSKPKAKAPPPPQCFGKDCPTSKGVFYLLPTGEANEYRRNEWLRRIGRKEKDIKKFYKTPIERERVKICDKHFSHLQFVPNFVNKHGVKVLKADALPDLNVKIIDLPDIDSGGPSSIKVEENSLQSPEFVEMEPTATNLKCEPPDEDPDETPSPRPAQRKRKSVSVAPSKPTKAPTMVTRSRTGSLKPKNKRHQQKDNKQSKSASKPNPTVPPPGSVVSIPPQVIHIGGQPFIVTSTINTGLTMLGNQPGFVIKNNLSSTDQSTAPQLLPPATAQNTGFVLQQLPTAGDATVTPPGPSPKKTKATAGAKKKANKISPKTPEKESEVASTSESSPTAKQNPQIPLSTIIKPVVPLIARPSGEKETPSGPQPVGLRPIVPKPHVPVGRLCRICGIGKMAMVPIFGLHGKQMQLAEMIERCMPIKVTPEDRLPRFCCNSCVNSLKWCNELVQACEDTNTRLLKLLKEEDEGNRLLKKKKRKSKKDSSDDEDDRESEIPLIYMPEADSELVTGVRKLAPKPPRLVVVTEKLIEVDKDLAPPVQVAQVVESLKAGLGTVTTPVLAPEVYQTPMDPNTLKKVVFENIKKPTPVLLGPPPGDSLVCSYCNETVCDSFSLFQHQLLKFRCRTCKISFCSFKARMQHYKSDHETKPQKKRVRNLNKTFFCKICNLKFNTSRAYRIHRTQNHGFTCNFCGLILRSRLTLTTHITKHLMGSNTTCKHCKTDFKSQSDLMFHIKNNRCIFMKKKYTHKCRICGDKFMNRDSLRGHVEMKHKPAGTSKGECRKCGKRFPNASRLRAHMSFHLPIKPEQCSVCSKRFVLKSQLQRHMGVHAEEKQYGCAHCPNRYWHKVHLIKHLRSKHFDSVKYQCRFCSKIFENEDLLPDHSKTCHPNFPLPSKTTYMKITSYQCDRCGKYYASESSLYTHLQKHKEKDMGTYLMCEFCGASFGNKNSMAKHMNQVHGQSELILEQEVIKGELVQKKVVKKTYSFPCTVCDKVYPSKPQLTAHMCSHTGIKPYKCTICGDTFTFYSSMKSHENLHTGLARFNCKYCSRTFLSRSSVTAHEKSHTGETPYECPTCHKKFARKFTCQLHMKTHMGEKPYSCDICKRGFTQKTSRDKHMQLHDQTPRQHSCDSCTFSTYKLRSLKDHMKTAHSSEVAAPSRRLRIVGQAIDDEDNEDLVETSQPFIIKILGEGDVELQTEEAEYQVQIISQPW